MRGEAQSLAIRVPGEAPGDLGGKSVNDVRPIQRVEDDDFGLRAAGETEKRELPSVRGTPERADRARAFPDLGPERAFYPHSGWAFSCDRELTRCGPVRCDNVLGELAGDSAH